MGEEKKIAFAGPWIGEFGWEIMTWIPYLRKLSHDYDKMIISTFPGVEALYTGFHCEIEFSPHDYPERVDDWLQYPPERALHPEAQDHLKPIKQYRVAVGGNTWGEHARYGSPIIDYTTILFHARAIDKGSFKNWPKEKWKVLAKELPEAMCIGGNGDRAINGIPDLRVTPLPELMNQIASASVVIGQSSGVMHLAVMCGTPVVVWGDDKLMNFGESLETRYKETWNPFGTPVTWINCEKAWDPEPEQIIEALKPRKAPNAHALDAMQKAAQSGRYIMEVVYVEQVDGKDAVISRCIPQDFPWNHLEQAMKQMTNDTAEAVRQMKHERRPDSWR